MAKERPGRSLHTVIMTAFLLCMGALLLFVMLTMVPRISTLLETNAVDRTKETVLQSVSTIDNYVDNMLSSLHFSSTLLPSDPSAADDSWKQRLLFLQQSRSEIITLAFFGEDGSLFYSTNGELRASPQEVKGLPWFQKAVEWEGTVTYFSQPHVQHLFSDQRPLVVTMARGMEYVKDGRWRTGVLLMDVDYAAFSKLVDDISLGASGYAYLIDEHGELVCHPKWQLIHQGLMQEDRAAVLSQTVGITRDTFQGRDRVNIITTVGQTRWRVVGVAYIDEILALQNAFIRIITVVIMSAALLSLASATVMAFFVTRPIRHLEDKMKKVEAGDLNVTIAEKGFREIRSVSASFNHMLRRIRVLMDRVVAEQETKRLHELNALQAQINPHFLYNTLDSIVWMEERGRSQEAITMVLALAKLFRISISKGRRFISVREELEHVRNYLIIQKMRFKDKFTYELTVQEEALSERTVKLIVQPLVENCINHAIDEAQGKELHIVIDVRVAGEDLLFTVADDGVGIREDLLPALLTTSSGENGIGLKNVHERIHLTYGPGYGLTIHSVEDEGTTITVRIPRGWEETP